MIREIYNNEWVKSFEKMETKALRASLFCMNINYFSNTTLKSPFELLDARFGFNFTVIRLQ
jgi:hypothetical protein